MNNITQQDFVEQDIDISIVNCLLEKTNAAKLTWKSFYSQCREPSAFLTRHNGYVIVLFKIVRPSTETIEYELDLTPELNVFQRFLVKFIGFTNRTNQFNQEKTLLKTNEYNIEPSKIFQRLNELFNLVSTTHQIHLDKQKQDYMEEQLHQKQNILKKLNR